MYQIGISSNEQTSPPVNSDVLNNICPDDEFAQLEKNSNPKEALAQLMDADFQFEDRPSYRNNAITFVVALLAIGSVSYFAFSSPEVETKVAMAEEVVNTPSVRKIDLDRPDEDPGIDFTITGSIENKLKETEIKLPAITPENANEREHLVKAGDTLYDIAKKYGTTVQELVADNAIENPGRLKLNKKLIIR